MKRKSTIVYTILIDYEYNYITSSSLVVSMHLTDAIASFLVAGVEEQPLRGPPLATAAAATGEMTQTDAEDPHRLTVLAAADAEYQMHFAEGQGRSCNSPGTTPASDSSMASIIK